ncbi:MAG: glycosyltransferase, partial [Bacteroidota bacterium]
MDSVVMQDYSDIEYIVIDGNSNDGTQDIVKSYSEKV